MIPVQLLVNAPQENANDPPRCLAMHVGGQAGGAGDAWLQPSSTLCVGGE